MRKTQTVRAWTPRPPRWASVHKPGHGLFQRATGRELWHLVLPGQRNDRATRDAVVDLEAAGRVREELRLPDNRKLWILTATGRREAAALLPAGAKLSALRLERDGQGRAFSEHALDVVATAGGLLRCLVVCGGGSG
ncbi:hypothetical protein AB0O82_30170 [Kitasatospora sp. NPDC088264]|uniref:hypothetical protein n=1 Tax=Kitasatospora sp. NPDC088264 TaxID=3155296 RepID=UPI00343E4C46